MRNAGPRFAAGAIFGTIMLVALGSLVGIGYADDGKHGGKHGRKHEGRHHSWSPQSTQGNPSAAQYQYGLPSQSGYCKRKDLELRGVVTDPNPGEADSQFTMLVKRANKRGRNLTDSSVTIYVNADTKIKRSGRQRSLGPIEPGDRVKVKYRVCKAELPLDATKLAVLAAKKVVAHSATD